MRIVNIKHMNLFIRFFASMLLFLFGLFLSSPIFASNIELSGIILPSSNYFDTCNWKIQCDELPNGQYICHVSNESLSAQWGIVQYVPVGNYGNGSVPTVWYCHIYSRGTIQEKTITYVWPDTYVYPFVRITKIQV